MRYAVYKPKGLIWASKSEKNMFHGYQTAFIEKYADYIFDPDRKNSIRYQLALHRLGIKKKMIYISKISRLNQECDAILMFDVKDKDRIDCPLKEFTGKKIVHTNDYGADILQNIRFYHEINVDLLLGHSQLDKRSEFFQKYYKDYIGKLVSVPFGYAARFKNTEPFQKRKKKAVGIGTIGAIPNPLEKRDDTLMVKEFAPYKYDHLIRAYIRDHERDFEDCIDSRFPSKEKQVDFTYDAVKVLNEYQMFINDESVLNFPPARTFEGLACGAVMVASDDALYQDFGFIPDHNYVSFQKGDYRDMAAKIRHYLLHQDELIAVQRESLKLAEDFSHERVAQKMEHDMNKFFAVLGGG